MRFLHLADLHLGYEQYHEAERFNDFSRAFLWLMAYAQETAVDFVVVAGDTFHKRTVDPLAMRVAVEGFRQLRCPIYAVEGNHEKAYYHEADSWCDYLAGEGTFHLLDGTCVTRDGYRVCGLKYAGAQTNERLRDLAASLEPSDAFTVLALHAGVEGVMAHVSGVELALLQALPVDYVALGHIHKPYAVAGLAYNPGSPENNSSEEALWPARGALLVTVAEDHSFTTENVVPPRRPFHRYDFDVAGVPEPAVVYDLVLGTVEAEAGAVVDVTLSGEVPFERTALDTRYLQEALATDGRVVQVRNATYPVGLGLSINTGKARVDVEAQVLDQVVGRDSRYRESRDEWVQRALTLKTLALNESPEDVLTFVEGIT